MRGKVFVFLGHPEEEGLGLSVKLPGSATLALDLPFASPAGYGLGKSGWVTARFSPRGEAARRAAEAVDRRELPRGGAQRRSWPQLAGGREPSFPAPPCVKRGW